MLFPMEKAYKLSGMTEKTCIVVHAEWDHVIRFCQHYHLGHLQCSAPVLILSLEEILFVALHVPIQLSIISSSQYHPKPKSFSSTNKDDLLPIMSQNVSNVAEESISEMNPVSLSAQKVESSSVLSGSDDGHASNQEKHYKLRDIDTVEPVFNLLSAFSEYPMDFHLRFAVYFYWKQRGWILKSGLKFGVDFLMYERSPTLVHARYALSILRPSILTQWRELNSLSRLAVSVAKELVVSTPVDTELPEKINLRYDFGLLLDRVQNLEYRGQLSRKTGELIDPPLESIFIPTDSINIQFTPLQREDALEHRTKSTVTTRIPSDILVIADEGPSWGRRRIASQSYRSSDPAFADHICIRGIVKGYPFRVISEQGIQPAFFFKRFSWILLHPVSNTYDTVAFTATVCPPPADFLTQELLRRYEGPLCYNDAIKRLLTISFAGYTKPVPELIDRICSSDESLEISYNPIHWRDCAIFSFNRVGLIGEAAKLSFPTYGDLVGTDIDEAWVMGKHLSILTSLNTIRDMRVAAKGKQQRRGLFNENRSNSSIRSCFFVTEALGRYSTDRKEIRGRVAELKVRRQHIVGLKYAGTRKPYRFLPDRFHSVLYRYRILKYLLGSWDTVPEIPSNMSRSQAIERTLHQASHEYKRQKKWRYSFSTLVKDIVAQC